jgi:O-6-methylguanine DNA methyltransferase
LVKDYTSGKEISLFEKIRNLKIDLNLEETFPSDFAISIIKYLIENIKYGKTTTYSEIGKAIGSRAYRAIGNVLRKNPLPLIIPCHRVIRKNGKIGGFMGYSNNSDNWQQQLKRDLLEMECFKD